MKKQNKKDKYGKKKVFHLRANPYDQDCIVVLNGQLIDAYNYFKKLNTSGAKKNLEYLEANPKLFEDKCDPEREARLHCALPIGYVMLVYHCDSWIRTVSNVAHEALHLTFEVLEGAGIELCEDSEEAYTYLEGYLVTEILKELY